MDWHLVRQQLAFVFQVAYGESWRSKLASALRYRSITELKIHYQQ